MHRPQDLSAMKANIQFLDFRYWQFELTCWCTYSNHTKLYRQTVAYVHYLFNQFLTGELYISLPIMNTGCSTSSASLINNSWSVISLMTSAGNLWTSQAVHDISSGSPQILLFSILYNPSSLYNTTDKCNMREILWQYYFKNHCKIVYKNRERKWAEARRSQICYSSVHVLFIIPNTSYRWHALFSMQTKADTINHIYYMMSQNNHDV